MDLEKSSCILKHAKDDVNSIIDLLKKDGQPDHYTPEEVATKQKFPKKLLASWVFQLVQNNSNMRKCLTESGDLLTECKRLKTENSKLRDQCDKLSKIEDKLKSAESNPETLINSLKTCEQSIMKLQEGMNSQRHAIDSIALTTTYTEAPPNPVIEKIPKDFFQVNRRLEKIEDVLNSFRYEQTEAIHEVNESQKKLDKILCHTTESVNRLRTPQTTVQTSKVLKTPNLLRTQKPHSTTTLPHTPNTSTQSSWRSANKSASRDKKVLLIHDSQLHTFIPENFSSAFSVEKFKGGSYGDVVNKHMRAITSKPNVDCYTLQLGVNDYRYDPVNKMDKAITNTKKVINRLLETSNAKVIVSLPTPTPGDLQTHTQYFSKQITDFITTKRKTDGNHRRIFTINNQSSFLKAIDLSVKSDIKCSPLQNDALHCSEYGVKKLCTNIKYGIYRSFGMRHPVRQIQTPSERSN